MPMITDESYDRLFATIMAADGDALDALDSTTDEDTRFMLSVWLVKRWMSERRSQLTPPLFGTLSISQASDGEVTVKIGGKPLPSFMPAPPFT